MAPCLSDWIRVQTRSNFPVLRAFTVQQHKAATMPAIPLGSVLNLSGATRTLTTWPPDGRKRARR